LLVNDAVEPPGAAAHNTGVQEHHGNGEHPQSLERRRQVLLWRTLGFLVVFGATTGLLRLALGLRDHAPARFVTYQLVLLALNALVGVLVVVRLRALRRR
jgi:hypothetical protein